LGSTKDDKVGQVWKAFSFCNWDAEVSGNSSHLVATRQLYIQRVKEKPVYFYGII